MKFAHIADCHLGAWSDEKLKRLNFEAFSKAIGICKEEKVDFLIVAGDLFHTTIPDLNLVEESVRKLKELKDEGIEIYILLGSHDYNPNSKSITDILNSAGFIGQIMRSREESGKIFLDFIQDKKTGAKLTGICAKKGGRDLEDFNRIDINSLEKEKGFKIFVFHNYLKGIASDTIPGIEPILLEKLPKHFQYYAGGHSHKKKTFQERDYNTIVFPGTLFGYRSEDLEETARGETRGFYIIETDEEKVCQLRFLKIKTVDIIHRKIDIEGLKTEEAKRKVWDEVTSLDVGGKVILLEVQGRLASGRPYQLDLRDLMDRVMAGGAITTLLKTEKLKGEAILSVKSDTEGLASIERAEFERALKDFSSSAQSLTGERGVSLAEKLLSALSQEQREEEKKRDYEEAINRKGKSLIEGEVFQ